MPAERAMAMRTTGFACEHAGKLHAIQLPLRRATLRHTCAAPARRLPAPAMPTTHRSFAVSVLPMWQPISSEANTDRYSVAPGLSSTSMRARPPTMTVFVSQGGWLWRGAQGV